MSKRFALLAVGGVISCGVLFGCLVITVVVLTPMLAAAFNATTSIPVDRIAFIDNDQNIQVVDAQGAKRIALTNDAATQSRAYAFPTWSPDSQRVAFLGLSGSRNQRIGGLYIAAIADSNRTTIFESPTNFPFYLYWSPNGQHIAFLTQGEDDLALMLGQADGKATPRQLETGSPFYWAWSPDSQSILLHTGGSQRASSDARMAFRHLQDSAAKKIARAPGEFEAPHYAPDGKAILYAGTTDNDDDALYLADAQDGNARSIVTYRGQIAFAWSPDSKRIAWLVTPEESDLINEGQIFVSDADGKNARAVMDEKAIAFYWSPNGRHIAYLILVRGENQGRVLGLAQQAALHLRWRVVDVESKNVQTLATFVPTAEFVALLPYFDQYARSLTFWSPDSQQFVYTQSESEDSGSVWVADVTNRTQPRRIGDGTLAVWSWK